MSSQEYLHVLQTLFGSAGKIEGEKQGEIENTLLRWLFDSELKPERLNDQFDLQSYFIELPSLLIPKGEERFFQVVTQRSLRAEKIVLTSDRSLDFVKVMRCMLGHAEPGQIREGMSAELFRPLSYHVPTFKIHMNPGQSCFLLLRNTGNSDVTISGTVLGKVFVFRD